MKELLEQMMKDVIRTSLMKATVTAVDRSGFTCDVQPVDGSAEVFDVKLRGIQAGDESSLILFPKVGAFVLIGMVSATDAYLLQASELDGFIIKQAGFRLEVDQEGNAVFNDGSFDGLVKLPVLQTEIEKLNSYLNAIKQAFSSFVPVPGDGGAALKTIMLSTISSLPVADLSQAGNEKIKH